MRALIFILMIPTCLFGDMYGLKKYVEQKIKESYVIASGNLKNNADYYYQIGRIEAYYEILNLIESDENG